MTTATQDNQVAVINNSIELFRSAPEILQANQDRTRKALAVGNSILEQWNEAWNMEGEDARMQALAAADERSNKFLVNSATALKEEKEARAAITQMMDEFKKMFTTAENDLDRTKTGTVTNRVQGNRDNYAGEVAKAAERKRLEAERIAAKQKDAIDIKAKIEVQLNQYFNDYLLAQKQKLTTYFNNLQLRQFADDAAQIRLYKPEFKEDRYNAFVPSISSRYHTQEEVQTMLGEKLSELYQGFAGKYEADMTAHRDSIIDQIPSKHQELKEAERRRQEEEAERKRQQEAEEERKRQIAAANAAEKERLEKEAAEQRQRDAERLEQLRKEQKAAEQERLQREAQEKERLEREAQEAAAKAEQDAEMKKQADQTMVMFEQEASLADLTTAPEARQGYEIVVLHQAAWVQIFQLWFEKEGKSLPIDKIGNTKLDQMKAWAEKLAHKTGEKIESKFLRYNESFKAVNRKAK